MECSVTVLDKQPDKESNHKQPKEQQITIWSKVRHTCQRKKEEEIAATIWNLDNATCINVKLRHVKPKCLRKHFSEKQHLELTRKFKACSKAAHDHVIIPFLNYEQCHGVTGMSKPLQQPDNPTLEKQVWLFTWCWKRKTISVTMTMQNTRVQHRNGLCALYSISRAAAQFTFIV